MIAELIEHWTTQGVTFALYGNDIAYDAPSDVATDELIAAIGPRKSAVIDYLRSRKGLAANDNENLDDEPSSRDIRPTNARRTRRSANDMPATWNDGIDWTAATPTCPKCRSAATWTDVFDRVRCIRCDPPSLPRPPHRHTKRRGTAPQRGR